MITSIIFQVILRLHRVAELLEDLHANMVDNEPQRTPETKEPQSGTA